MSDWQPLLDGADAARAWQAIDAIAATLAEPDADGASLDRGSAGRALFFEYLARARADLGLSPPLARAPRSRHRRRRRCRPIPSCSVAFAGSPGPRSTYVYCRV